MALGATTRFAFAVLTRSPRLAALILLAAAIAPAAWGAPSDYDWACLRHKPMAVADLALVRQQPERFQAQAVVVAGRITGTLRGEVLTTILFRLDGEDAETVHLLARPEQSLTPVGQQARAVARLAEPPGESVVFHLLAMAEAEQTTGQREVEQAFAELAARQLAQAQGATLVAPQPRYELPSRGGPPPPSEDRILAAYEQAIAYFNSRLDQVQRTTIARHIIDFSRHIGVDARLVMAVVAAESNFNPNATSRAGAMGLGQLMPATARGMGVRNAYDTRENLWAAIRIVRGHLENNDGDLALALACYNAGPGAVRRYGGVPPYRETQNYIRKVIQIYLQLAPEMAQ